MGLNLQKYYAIVIVALAAAKRQTGSKAGLGVIKFIYMIILIRIVHFMTTHTFCK